MPRTKPKRPNDNVMPDELTEADKLKLKEARVPTVLMDKVEWLALNMKQRTVLDSPRKAEVRAALDRVLSTVQAVRRTLDETDQHTLSIIELGYQQPSTYDEGATPHTVDSTRCFYETVRELEACVIATDGRTGRASTSIDRNLSIKAARQLRTFFEEAGIPFSLSKLSPAAATLRAIMSISEPVTAAAVEHIIKEVMNNSHGKTGT